MLSYIQYINVLFNTWTYSVPSCNGAAFIPYHFPGVADIVGFFANFSQFV